MPDIDQDTGEINPHSTQGRILSALETLRTFPEAMAAAAVGIRDVWYDLIRPMKVVEEAFRDIWEAIGTQLEVPVLYGAPE